MTDTPAPAEQPAEPAQAVQEPSEPPRGTSTHPQAARSAQSISTPRSDGNSPGAEDQDDQDDTDLSPRDLRYREQLRKAEGELATLRSRVEHVQRAEVERLASDKLLDAEDFWVGAALADVVDSDGNVSEELVTRKVNELVANRPHWGRKLESLPKRDTLRSGASNPNIEAAPTSWASVVRGQD